MRAFWGVASVLLLLNFAGFVFAQEGLEGQARALLCAACHGEKGISVQAEYPNLAGQKERYLQLALRSYQRGERRHAIMSPIAKGLSEADIVNLAAFYASQPSYSPAK